MKSIEIMAPVHGWAIAFADADDVEGHVMTSPTKKSTNWGVGAKDDDEDVEGHAFISSGGTSKTGTTRG